MGVVQAGIKSQKMVRNAIQQEEAKGEPLMDGTKEERHHWRRGGGTHHLPGRKGQ